MYDYGDKQRNDAERERVMEDGRIAARAGKSSFGAGGYKPGDSQRASDWLLGYREVIPSHNANGSGWCVLCEKRFNSWDAIVESRHLGTMHEECYIERYINRL